jgi:hypothetical protein
VAHDEVDTVRFDILVKFRRSHRGKPENLKVRVLILNMHLEMLIDNLSRQLILGTIDI